MVKTQVTINVSKIMLDDLAAHPRTTLEAALTGKLHGALLMICDGYIHEGVDEKQVQKAAAAIEPEFVRGVLEQAAKDRRARAKAAG